LLLEVLFDDEEGVGRKDDPANHHLWCLVLLVNPRVRAPFAARELA
jgi:hypothetical protein